MQTADITTFLKLSRSIPVIDVRSSAEFSQGHIPGAYNLPLFSDDERAAIGLNYKEAGKHEALLMGLDIVGPKMSSFIRQAEQIAPGKKILIHCWRGGMRSASIAWLLQFAGFETTLLSGGYKAYRNAVLTTFDRSYVMLILGGMTGSGKTAILKELAKLGEQVIDLEELACHQGSAFGSMNKLVQPTQEQFENDLAFQLNRLDHTQRIWLEDESITIGRIVIPNGLWQQIRSTLILKLEIAKEERIRNLVEAYGNLSEQFLAGCIGRITKKLGGQHAKAALEALERKEYGRVAEIMLVYYDKTYGIGLSKRDPLLIIELILEPGSPQAHAKRVLNFSESLDIRTMYGS